MAVWGTFAVMADAAQVGNGGIQEAFNRAFLGGFRNALVVDDAAGAVVVAAAAGGGGGGGGDGEIEEVQIVIDADYPEETGRMFTGADQGPNVGHFFVHLPHEVRSLIVSFLDVRSLCRLNESSWIFYDASRGRNLWLALYRREFKTNGKGGQVDRLAATVFNDK